MNPINTVGLAEFFIEVRGLVDILNDISSLKDGLFSHNFDWVPVLIFFSLNIILGEPARGRAFDIVNVIVRGKICFDFFQGLELIASKCLKDFGRDLVPYDL